MFYALENGDIDMTNCAMIEGASNHGVPRRWYFQYSCSPSGWELAVFVRKGSEISKSYKNLRQNVCAMDMEKRKFVVVNKALGQVLRDSIGCDIIIDYVQGKKSAFNAFLANQKYLGVITEFLADVPEEFSSEVTSLLTGEYIPTAYFFRSDYKYEDKEKVNAFLIGLLVFFILLFGLVLFEILYIIWARSKRSSVKSVHVEELTDEAVQKLSSSDDKYQAIPDSNSIGDQDDPDYVAPQF